MTITLPEHFEVYDIVQWNGKMRIPFPLVLFKKHLYIVREIDWRLERLHVYGSNEWYYFKEMDIVKKNCPIVKLVI